MRRVIYIPAWHTLNERGGRAPYQDILDRTDIPDDTRKMIEAEHIRFFKACELYWQDTKEYLNGRLENGDIDPKTSHVYSDTAALPWEEMEIFYRDSASEGSHHAQIVLDLVGHGAQYEITESLDTLFNSARAERLLGSARRRYERVKAQPASKEKSQLLEERASLIKNLTSIRNNISTRDNDIADVINRSLPDDYTGILIMGASHRVSQFLPEDIAFVPLHERLVELTNGDSGKSEVKINPEMEFVIRPHERI